MKIPRSVGTHDGTFHADEVTACALLLLFDLIDRECIVRTRQHDELVRCEYVCDVGGVYDPERKLFDHHQVEYQGSMSSAGMILLHLFQSNIISLKEREFLENSLIIGVDAHDNGKELHSNGVCTYSHIISNFTPISHEADDKQQDEAFFRALEFALDHLD
ncbi:MAG: MYG1 family protein, partial [Parachlamydiaceae bacterium]|nr:MYG1 family protein [Parachlamydiaceae bacterium]